MNSTKLIDTKIPLAICLFGFFVWGGLLTFKYYHFGYYDWDLAFFAQAMWMLSHQGSLYNSLFDVNFLANHSNLIAYLILPLYKIFSHPMTLVYLKIISYILAGYGIYLLAKEKSSQTLAIGLMLLYYFYPANIFGLIYEFDFESLAPGFLVFLLWAYRSRKVILFYVLAGLLMLIKENMPLIICAFGVHGFITRKEKWVWGVYPFILGASIFYVLVHIFIPVMGGKGMGAPHPYIGLYRTWGNSLGQVILYIFSHPLKTFHILATPTNIRWLRDILGIFLFLPCLSPGMMWFVLPIFAQELLSSAHQQHTIFYAYGLTLAPFIVIALADILTKLRISVKFKIVIVCLFVLTSSMCLWGYRDVLEGRFVTHWDMAWVNAGRQMIKQIPAQARVVSTFAFLAELSQREHLYALHKIYAPAYQNKNWSYQLPKNVEYALIDFNDPWLKADLQNNFEFTNSRVRNFLSSGWVIQEHYDSMVLYKRKG